MHQLLVTPILLRPCNPISKWLSLQRDSFSPRLYSMRLSLNIIAIIPYKTILFERKADLG